MGRNTFVIAWRSLWRNKRRTIISVSAIAFGLALAVFFLALAEGVYQQMIRDACKMQAGHFTIEHADYRQAPAIDLVLHDADVVRKNLAVQPGVVGTKALILGQGVVKSSAGAVGVSIVGVEPQHERETSPLAGHIVKGAYLDPSDHGKVVLGVKLAERLKVDVGKKLVVSSNNVAGQLVDELLRVKGIFEVNAEAVDGYVVQIPIGFARKVFGMSRHDVTQLGALVADPHERDSIMQSFAATLQRPDWVVLPWEQVMPELAAYVQLDRGSNQVFQGIIIFLSLFTIFNTIVMSVLERTHEFAVMMALGTPARWMRAQLVTESAFLGFLGVAVGLGIGGAVSHYFEVHGIDMSSLVNGELSVSGFAVDTTVRAFVSSDMLAALGGVVLVATVTVGLFATRRIPRISVADILRYRG